MGFTEEPARLETSGTFVKGLPEEQITETGAAEANGRGGQTYLKTGNYFR